MTPGKTKLRSVSLFLFCISDQLSFRLAWSAFLNDLHILTTPQCPFRDRSDNHVKTCPGLLCFFSIQRGRYVHNLQDMHIFQDDCQVRCPHEIGGTLLCVTSVHCEEKHSSAFKGIVPRPDTFGRNPLRNIHVWISTSAVSFRLVKHPSHALTVIGVLSNQHVMLEQSKKTSNKHDFWLDFTSEPLHATPASQAGCDVYREMASSGVRMLRARQTHDIWHTGLWAVT